MTPLDFSLYLRLPFHSELETVICQVALSNDPVKVLTPIYRDGLPVAETQPEPLNTRLSPSALSERSGP